MIAPQSVDSVLLIHQPGGKQWDCIIGAMKPGAHLLLLSSVKGHHVGTIAAEDNGLEVRDTLAYVFSNGDSNVAMQLIAMARKPMQGTVAENVLKWSTGGLNIDRCRVTTQENLNGGAYSKTGNRKDLPGAKRSDSAAGMMAPGKTVEGEFKQPEGRWPANLLHDGSDEVTSIFPSPHGAGHSRGGGLSKDGGSMFCGNHDGNGMRFGDSGSASRFFYSAPTFNILVAYLLKLITPIGGTVLTNYTMGNLPREYNYVTDCGQ